MASVDGHGRWLWKSKPGMWIVKMCDCPNTTTRIDTTATLRLAAGLETYGEGD